MERKGGYVMFIRDPKEIETRSFEIIAEELGETNWSEEEAKIIMRVIHTTADLEFADLVEIGPGAIAAGIKAIKAGSNIITDTQMALAGINKRVLDRFGGEVKCFTGMEIVRQEAKRLGITRSMMAMRLAARERNKQIFVIGNAPTALFELKRLIEEKQSRPDLIIGVPVGFVGAAESKESIRGLGIPYIITRGRKGGSNIAACIVNALLYMIDESRGDSW
jgi:precorrin-8X/cobalt-precorrin-8 methylmutase